MLFLVGGFDEAAAYGSVWEFRIPGQPSPSEQNGGSFGITWGGQGEYAARLVHGYDPRVLAIAQQHLRLKQQQVMSLRDELRQVMIGIPYAVLPLQDCIDLAVFLVRTTIQAQKLAIGIRGVGGTIDVGVITRRDGLRIIQQKTLSVESNA